VIFDEHRVWGPADLQRSLIAFDRRGLWTRVLRRYLPAAVPVRRQERLPSGVGGDDRQAEAPPWISVVVVERGWTEDDAETWARWRKTAPAMLMLAVVPEGDDLAILWMTTLGAQAAFQHLGQAPRLARCAAQFWERIPAPALGDHGRIWNNLPWKPRETA